MKAHRFNGSARMVQNAIWLLTRRARCQYVEARPEPDAGDPWFTLPFIGDCSWFVETCALWAGILVDPLGEVLGSSDGNTQTEAAADHQISVEQTAPGDLVVYDVADPLSMQHTAVIASSDGKDPLTISMGKPGDPSYVYVSQDGRTPTYYRFDTTARLARDDTPAATIAEKYWPLGPFPTFKRGDVPASKGFLRLWRLILKADGCYPWPVALGSGFGRLTFNATRRFQKKNGLPTTGVVTAKEWSVGGARGALSDAG